MSRSILDEDTKTIAGMETANDPVPATGLRAWRITSGVFLVVALIACVRAAMLGEIMAATVAWTSAVAMLAARVGMEYRPRNLRYANENPNPPPAGPPPLTYRGPDRTGTERNK